jgi:glycosyltransferase involved in cell wall biosynthesis
MKSFAAIIPTYNREATILRAIHSIARQTIRPQTLIVIDDGSIDQTEELVTAWIRVERPPFKVIFEKTSNRGVSAARNLGVQLADSDWLAFLDSDDEWLPNKIENQLPLSETFPMVHGEENWIRNGVRVQAPRKYLKSGGRVFNRCVDLCFISPSSVLIERKLFERMNGFREDFPVCEDYELWLRIAAQYEVGFTSEPVLNKYGGHGDQLSMRFRGMDYFRAKALRPFLEQRDLSREEQMHAAKTLLQKCEILLGGYVKHDNMADAREVEGWREAARARLDRLHPSRLHGELS